MEVLDELVMNYQMTVALVYCDIKELLVVFTVGVLFREIAGYARAFRDYYTHHSASRPNSNIAQSDTSFDIQLLFLKLLLILLISFSLLLLSLRDDLLFFTFLLFFLNFCLSDC